LQATRCGPPAPRVYHSPTVTRETHGTHETNYLPEPEGRGSSCARAFRKGFNQIPYRGRMDRKHNAHGKWRHKAASASTTSVGSLPDQLESQLDHPRPSKHATDHPKGPRS